MKRVVLILICLSLTACSNSSLIRKPGWLKNPFAKSADKPEKAARQAGYIDAAKNKTWYCYPDATAKDWDCQQQPETNRSSRTRVTQAETPRSVHSRSMQSMIPPVAEIPVSAPTPPPPMPDMESSSRPKSAESSLQEDAGYLLKQPGDSFAVQLIALESLDQVLDYVKQLNSDTPRVARILTNDKLWYVAVLGIYPDKILANQAIKQWSQTSGVSEIPWVRQVDSLQAAMREAEEHGDPGGR
jgi:septal ring-binding cell division protein DamX